MAAVEAEVRARIQPLQSGAKIEPAFPIADCGSRVLPLGTSAETVWWEHTLRHHDIILTVEEGISEPNRGHWS